MSYRFDQFSFDRDRGLLDDGHDVPLEPQAFELLSYLIEHRDRVVTRDELIENVWGGRIVSEAALSTQIRAVRRVLGDDRAQQRYIRTHPKRGFQFVAHVKKERPNLPEQRDSQRASSKTRRMLVGSGIAAISLIASVLVYFWAAQSSRMAEVDAPSLSIAVLPFDNLSGDPSVDYLADAFTEELITDLSRIRDALVISRSTSFAFRDNKIDAATAAKELHVRYVLEGSVRVDGDMVRIIAQLIDGETNTHLWSDRYDKPLSSLFDLRDNVTGRIASVLRAEMREADTRRQPPDISGSAWDLALRGNVLLYYAPSDSDYQRAEAYLNSAIELDPTLSSAWSGLGQVHFDASSKHVPGVSKPNSAEIALNAAQKAAETDPRNAEAYWLLGFLYIRTGQPERAMSVCETSMNLNPNLDCGWICAGLVHMARGNPEEAIPNIEYALRLNPIFRAANKHRYLGIANFQSGQYEPAIDALRRALALAPGDFLANITLPAALALNGDLESAQTALDQWLKRLDQAPPPLAQLQEKISWLGPAVGRVIEGLQAAGYDQV